MDSINMNSRVVKLIEDQTIKPKEDKRRKKRNTRKQAWTNTTCGQLQRLHQIRSQTRRHSY
jgi:hypothetical protein